MDKEEILSVTEELGGSFDSPFEGDFDTVVLRHRDTKKWFGLYFSVPKRYFREEGKAEFCLNLKCDPALASILFQNYAGILPAYHMNKTHWITVRLRRDVPEEEIKNLMRLSFDLTQSAKQKKL